MKHFTKSDLLLLTTTFIWGWSFIIVKWAVAFIDPYFFIFSRFLLAFLLLAVFFHVDLKANWAVCLRPGAILGLILSLGFFTQTWGLKYTTASASGFITGLSVVLVAIFAAALKRRLPSRPVLFGIVSATAGLFLITVKGPLVFQSGDLLTLACAVLFALHVVYTDYFAQDKKAGVLTLIQFAAVTALAGLAHLFFGDRSLNLTELTGWQWMSLLYCGVPATALAFLFQTKAQQKIPPFRTAVLLATEPLFAGLFAMGIGFDPFEWRVVFGGLLILTGMVLASWDVKKEPVPPVPEAAAGKVGNCGTANKR